MRDNMPAPTAPPRALRLRRFGHAAAAALALAGVGCGKAPVPAAPSNATSGSAGCAVAYPPPSSSPYVLPWAVGQTVQTGLTNCSSSYHAAGRPDEFAFDFNMPEGTPFFAARAGRVSEVVNDMPSGGGGSGNYVAVDHGDGTSGLYLHAPMDGISVGVGTQVRQGEALGVTGRSGLAGYPHLHFIVVHGDIAFPYEGVPISFRNASPEDAVLRGQTEYTALPYGP